MTALKAGNYAPVYLLMGQEPYYIDAVTDFIQSNALDEMAREFDQTIIYGKDVQSIDSVINAAKRFPMMGQRSVIIVKEAQNIKDWADLVYYLQQPQPTTVLVFCYKYGTMNANTKVFKEIDRQGVVLKSEPIRDSQIPQWINDYVRAKQISIEPKAVQMLAEHLGADLAKIVAELDKLILNKPESGTITAALVESNVGISKDYNTFELFSAIANHDILKANRITYYFAANQKEHPIQMVVPQLFGFFANLMMYHYLPSKESRYAAQELHINPYFIRDYEQAARHYSPMHTMQIIGYLRETDARSKGVGDNNSDSLHLYQELMYKILHKVY